MRCTEKRKLKYNGNTAEIVSVSSCYSVSEEYALKIETALDLQIFSLQLHRQGRHS